MMNKRMTQYIAEYKKRSENEEEDLTEDLEALILDAFNGNSPTAENNDEVKNFIATFDFINYAAFIIMKLNNRFFIYSLNAGINNELIIAKSTNPFAYINIERYTSKKFYNVMINTGASRHSTAGYNQYLTYKTIENVNINESKTNVINV